MESVTYNGPGSAYRVPDFEGEEYVLRAGQPTSVPAELAKQLLATEGQEFTTHTAEPTISDAARKLAAANDIDLSEVKGTGSNDGITKGDVEAAIKAKEANS